MRPGLNSALVLAVSVVAATFLHAQQGDPDRVIPGGGIHVQGWMGGIDAASTAQGRVLNDARFAQEGTALHVTTGPAATFWNPVNTVSGDYTVKATFLEPKFMNLNSHPHSYGKAQLVGAGKLQSTDGMYGIRFTHNVEAVITGFGVTKN